MVATDTVVGIVGAVLLAGIMAGVFAYEYNNPPPGPGDETAAARAAFEKAFPALNATDDLDQDGTQNYLDVDLDGNGVNDTVQTTNFVVAFPFDGATPSPPAQSFQQAYDVPLGKGARMVHAWLNWTSTTPEPLPPSPNFTCSFGPAGAEPLANCTAAVGGTANRARSLSLMTEDLDRGNHTFQLTMQTPGPESGYRALVLVDYGTSQRYDPSGPIEF